MNGAGETLDREEAVGRTVGTGADQRGASRGCAEAGLSHDYTGSAPRSARGRGIPKGTSACAASPPPVCFPGFCPGACPSWVTYCSTRATRARVQLCGAEDWAYDDHGGVIVYGTCNRPAGHDDGGWHVEHRGERVWAEWRGPADSRAPGHGRPR